MKIKSVGPTLLLLLTLLGFSSPLVAQRAVIMPDVYRPGMTTTDIMTAGSGSATPTNIVTNSTMVYGITVDTGVSTSTTPVFANFFNVASGSVTPGTTASVFTLTVAANVQVSIPWATPIGIPFSTAMSVNCTTTRNTTSGGGATGTTAPCHVVVFRKTP